MEELPIRNLRNLSIPTKIQLEYRNAIEFIINHLEIDNYSDIVRMCVFDKRDWIKGSKVLVDSGNPHNKSKNLSYLRKIWIDILKEGNKSTKDQQIKLYRNFIKDLFLVIEKLDGGK